MSIPRRFHRLHLSAPLACRSGWYGLVWNSRYVVTDYCFCLSALAVHSYLYRYTDTGSAVCLHCFPESFAARPTGRWCGCTTCRHSPAGVFQSAGQAHRSRNGSAVRYVLRSGHIRHRNRII